MDRLLTDLEEIKANRDAICHLLVQILALDVVDDIQKVRELYDEALALSNECAVMDERIGPALSEATDEASLQLVREIAEKDKMMGPLLGAVDSRLEDGFRKVKR